MRNLNAGDFYEIYRDMLIHTSPKRVVTRYSYGSFIKETNSYLVFDFGRIKKKHITTIVEANKCRQL